ncbi:DUF488 domain-containing protein [Pseudochryseolinea flava]|uniref:DUF488 domain-containing protein n=1 Tax=Pseudochryseolinea flava TaxID=2059302 RepID=A0A364Y0D0_9BACT|nr:DUF488 domain-containing protein [Pseudochryseolinea flava]RAV99544.1 hypothetical protein DQQ10_18250 [Pseudochryseolinea flava]
MNTSTLFSIGHGTRSIEEFVRLLKIYGINYLIDVRSVPYSTYSPQYNRERLQQSLTDEGIMYVFMGDSIGGRPSDPSCYDLKGNVNYEKVKSKSFYQEGIARLKTAQQKELPIALMCSETKPTECHRSKLIGRTLLEDRIALQHIDEHGNLKDQLEVWKVITNHESSLGLFGTTNLS